MIERETCLTGWHSEKCRANGIDIHYLRSGVGDEHRKSLTLARSDLLAQASVRSPHRPREMVELLVDAKLRTSVNAFQVLMPPNPEYRELITNIDVPILLVLGDRGIVSLDTARELQSLNPSLSFELIRDAGHGLPYDEPDRLGAIVESFLRTLCFRG